MAVIFIFAFALTGCGSAFDGNYKEAKAEEVAAFSENVENAEGTKIDYSNGVSAKVTMNTTIGAVISKMDMDYKMKGVGDKIEVAGKVFATGEKNNENFDASVYYKEGYMYINGKYAGVTVKQKTAISIEGMMSQMDLGMIDHYSSLPAILAEYSFQAELPENIKVYFDIGKDTQKVKVEINISENESTSKTTIYLIYDADYNLTALKVESKTSSNVFGAVYEVELNLTVEVYNGKINIPSDLDTYTEK